MNRIAASQIHLGNILEGRAEETAVVFQDESFSFGELARRTENGASLLVSAGVRKGDAAALLCPNSPEFIFAYFSAARAGCACVPLNFALTENEIGYILSDCRAKALLVHESLLSRLSPGLIEAFGERLFVLDSGFGKTPAKAQLPEILPGGVCSILYTSGTTGKPKGVMLTHSNLLSNALAAIEAIGVTEKDVFLSSLPMFHTFGFTVNVLVPLCVGCRIVVHSAFRPKEIVQSVEKDGVTVFAAVPSMLAVIAQTAKGADAFFSKLRLAVSGGAPMPVELLRFFEQRGVALVEGYGLTETSPIAALNPLDGERKPGSVGLPLPGVSIRCAGAFGEPLGANEIGELLIKGPNVMAGYLNNEEAFKEAMDGDWFRTGDLGFIDEDGYVFIADRKKDLIITAGMNVYPREIEEVLYRHASVAEAAVVGAEDALKGEVGKAFVSLKEGASCSESELLSFLKESLAAYKIPKTVEFRNSLPKTATGKIAKRELR